MGHRAEGDRRSGSGWLASVRYQECPGSASRFPSPEPTRTGSRSPRPGHSRDGAGLRGGGPARGGELSSLHSALCPAVFSSPSQQASQGLSHRRQWAVSTDMLLPTPGSACRRHFGGPASALGSPLPPALTQEAHGVSTLASPCRIHPTEPSSGNGFLTGPADRGGTHSPDHTWGYWGWVGVLGRG